MLCFEFKAAVNAYLSRLRGKVAVQTLADLIAFNIEHAEQEMPLFGQDLFEDSQRRGDLKSPAYIRARSHLDRLADSDGLATMFRGDRLDVLVAPGNGPAELIEPVWGDHFENSGGWPPIGSAAAVAGYPSLTVPAAFIRGLPVGVIFVAPRNADGLLLHVGHAYERATKARRPPTYVSG